ncbi:Ig-like domain-containing protein, partial [Candidatus Latescibacterota bacterium]
MKRIVSDTLGLLIIFCIGFFRPAYGASRFASVIDFSNPSNATLIKIAGEDSLDYAGNSLTTGDINGDGKEDIILGAYKTYDGRGATYVVFGSATIFNKDSIDLNTSSGILKIIGKSVVDWSGYSVAAGDIDGDGYDDVIIGAHKGDPLERINAGEVYVIFGNATLHTTGEIDLSGSTPDVTRIYGDTQEDYAGFSVAAGDIDGDGYDDVIIGAHQADYSGRRHAGKTYVVFGSSDFSTKSTIDLNGSPSGVLSIFGETEDDLSGYSVASGDLDGNGYDEVIIGAYNAYDTHGGTYIIGGYADIDTLSTIDLATYPDDMVIVYGGDPDDHSGSAVAAGNMDGDSFDDLIIGAPGGDLQWRNNAGETNIFRGGPDFKNMGIIYLGLPSFELLRVIGAAADDQLGSAVSVGDLNGDGYDELIIGASSANPADRNNAGETYIIWSDMYIHDRDVIDLGSKEQEKITKLFGAYPEDASGEAVGVGDFDGDGFKDAIIGSSLSDPGDRNNAGEVYVIKGFGTTSIIEVIPREDGYGSKDTDIKVFFNSDLTSLTMDVVNTISGPVNGSLVWSGSSATFTPTSSLAIESLTEVTVNGINVDDEVIPQKIWTFYVKEEDLPPRFISLSPPDNDVNVGPDEDVIVTFSSDICADSTTVSIKGKNQRTITMASSWSDSTLTLINSSLFQLSETITVSISAADLYGDRADSTWSFSVRPEAGPVNFTFSSPGYFNNISKNAFFQILFPADIDKSSVETLIEGSKSGVINGSPTWSNTL